MDASHYLWDRHQEEKEKDETRDHPDPDSFQFRLKLGETINMLLKYELNGVSSITVVIEWREMAYLVVYYSGENDISHGEQDNHAVKNYISYRIKWSRETPADSWNMNVRAKKKRKYRKRNRDYPKTEEKHQNITCLMLYQWYQRCASSIEEEKEAQETSNRFSLSNDVYLSGEKRYLERNWERLSMSIYQLFNRSSRVQIEIYWKYETTQKIVHENWAKDILAYDLVLKG